MFDDDDELPPFKSTETAEFVEKVSKKLASELFLASLEKRGDEAEAAAMSLTIAASALVMLFRVLNPSMSVSELLEFVKEDWVALAPMFEGKSFMPAGTVQSKGGDA